MGFFADLRLAFRNLRRSPAYSVVAVFTLALGVAATTTMFSVVNGVLFRPLTFPAAEQLVDLAETMLPKMSQGAVSAPDLADWQQAKAFSALGGYSTWPGFSLAEGDRPERIPGVRVAPNLLAALGARPLLGRLLLPGETVDGRDGVVVLSERLWRRRFAAAPDIVGRQVRINGESRTVVGVVPAWLEFPPHDPAQLFVPLVISQEQEHSRGNHWMRVVGRLRPGVPISAAQAELDAIAARLRQQYPDFNEGRGVAITPLQGRLTAGVREPLWILFAAVGLLLAVACANVANLLLARGAARWRETAVRTALGAGRLHLARSSVAEGLVLALAGTIAAVPLIFLGLRSLLLLAPADLPRRSEIALDGQALAFSLLAACVTGLLFSLAPMWQVARLDIGELLKAGARASSGARSRRLRSILVVTEMAMSLLLLTGAGLLLRSFWNLARVQPGFRTEGVLTADLALPAGHYGKDEQVVGFYHRLLARVATLPGVTASGMITLIPARDWGWNSSVAIVGAPPLPRTIDNWIETRAVSAGYFPTLGIRLVDGRLIDDRDERHAPLAVVINETAAKRFWPNAQAVGSRVVIGGGDPWQVVGVVRDVHNAGPARAPLPEAYFPHAQFPERNMSLVLRTPGNPLGLVPGLRQAVKELDREIPLDRVTTMTQVVSGSLGAKRFQAILLGIFAGLAVTLAAVGLYGLLAYSVVQRRSEIAVRVALGATAAQVRALILRDAFRLVLPGLLIGLAAAAALRRFLAALLFGIAPLDGPTLVAVALALGGVALLASWIPAARAVRVDPLTALRED